VYCAISAYVIQPNARCQFVVSLFVLVVDSLTVSVRLENDTDDFTSGETIALACVSESSSSSDGLELTWYKDGHMLWLTDDRIRTVSSKRGKAKSTTSHLIISDALTDDSGEYSCTVAKGRQTVTSSTVVVQVQGTYRLARMTDTDQSPDNSRYI